VSALGRYRELAARVDAFFDKVHTRHQAEMACAVGCSDCCVGGLTLTSVEAAAIGEGLAALSALSPETRAELAARARAAVPARCAALDSEGRCGIYADRPLVCRSHGVPVRTTPPGKTALPLVSACEKNFAAGAGLGALAPDAILDQTTLSTVLLAVDSAFAAEVGRARGERVSLAALLGAAAGPA
jgi:hypothetical protein